MTQKLDALTILECIISAAVILGLDDVAASLETDFALATEDEKATADKLLKCANFVFNEIAADYLPLKVTEEVITNDGDIYFNDLSKKAVDVFRVLQNGKSLAIRMFYDHLNVAAKGKLTIEYSFEPLERDLSGVSDYTHKRLSKRCVAYGIACEYCLISGMSEEAVVFNKRYRDSLELACRDKFERKVKLRQWI